MSLPGNNFAYVDGANLHKGVLADEWKLDYGRFRVWLDEKYGVKRAYLFLGLVSKYSALYTTLQEQGFTLVFKETVSDGDGQIKGNCDADLVLRAVVDAFEADYDQPVIVSGDGDYACLVKFLDQRKKLKAVLSPGRKCSVLLKRTNVKISYLYDQKTRIGRK